MKFESLLEILGEEPLFESGLLLAGGIDPRDVRRQLSRWAADGKIYQLRRGLYCLAPPYQKVAPHPFVVANRMVTGSYVSCQSVLAYYGLIPEAVRIAVSVTTKRPGYWVNPIGAFVFHHLTRRLFYGYQRVSLPAGQQASLAYPEKALLDLVHLAPGGDDPDYLRELRLQNLDGLEEERLQALARQSGMPKLRRAAEQILKLAQEESQAYEDIHITKS